MNYNYFQEDDTSHASTPSSTNVSVREKGTMKCPCLGAIFFGKGVRVRIVRGNIRGFRFRSRIHDRKRPLMCAIFPLLVGLGGAERGGMPFLVIDRRRTLLPLTFIFLEGGFLPVFLLGDARRAFSIVEVRG